MSTRKLVVILFSLIISVTLLFTGCLPVSAPPSTPNNTTMGDEVLNLYGVDPLTLDPAVSGDVNSHRYITQIFSGLLRLNDKLEAVPDIAREWQLSQDGRIYTFFLREDVKFHDGREVKADDIKYSWERACRPSTESRTASNYLGDIIGVSEMLSGEAEEISGVEVINDYTLRVTIDKPKSYFLSKLTYPTSFVVDRNNVSLNDEWWRYPNGTGPFELEQWEKNSLIKLTRNSLYYNEPAILDTVAFQLYGGVPMNLYETGEIDVTDVSMYYIDKVTDERGPFHEDLKVFPELSFFYIGFNTEKPPFDDVLIRRAFTQAVDKEKIASLVFRDMVKPAYGILPQGMPGYNEDLRGLEYDVDAAKRLIADSEYGSVDNLPPITVTASGQGAAISGDLESIIYQWHENLGVDVSVRQLEPERFLYHIDGEVDEMFFSGWVADYPHPQDFLDILFYTGAENNSGGYSNPEVDALIDMANGELNTEYSLELYRQAEENLVEDAACLPLWFGENYVLVKPYVEGYELNYLGMPTLVDTAINLP